MQGRGCAWDVLASVLGMSDGPICSLAYRGCIRSAWHPGVPLSSCGEPRRKPWKKKKTNRNLGQFQIQGAALRFLPVTQRTARRWIRASLLDSRSQSVLRCLTGEPSHHARHGLSYDGPAIRARLITSLVCRNDRFALAISAAKQCNAAHGLTARPLSS